jgi:hypothetical protein
MGSAASIQHQLATYRKAPRIGQYAKHPYNIAAGRGEFEMRLPTQLRKKTEGWPVPLSGRSKITSNSF